MNLFLTQAEIRAWHERAFPWAGPVDCLVKLKSEVDEAIACAEGLPGETEMLADELADCAICVIAASARGGIDLGEAIANKLPRVMAKYADPQPEPPRDWPEQLELIG